MAGLTLKDLEKSLAQSGFSTEGGGQRNIKKLLAETVGSTMGGTTVSIGKNVQKQDQVADDIRAIKLGQQAMLVEQKQTNSTLTKFAKETLGFYESNQELITRLLINQGLADERGILPTPQADGTISEKGKVEKKEGLGTGIGGLGLTPLAIGALVAALPDAIKWLGETFPGVAQTVSEIPALIKDAFLVGTNSLTRGIARVTASVSRSIYETAVDGIRATRGLAPVDRTAGRPPVGTNLPDEAPRPPVRPNARARGGTGGGPRDWTKMFQFEENIRPPTAPESNKPLTRAQRAATQPRDPSGRFLPRASVGAVASEGAEVVESRLKKFLSKKVLANTVGKVIPGIGGILAAFDAFNRAREGDLTGAVISGIITGGSILELTGVGTALGATAALTGSITQLTRDAYKAIYGDFPDRQIDEVGSDEVARRLADLGPIIYSKVQEYMQEERKRAYTENSDFGLSELGLETGGEVDRNNAAYQQNLSTPRTERRDAGEVPTIAPTTYGVNLEPTLSGNATRGVDLPPTQNQPPVIINREGDTTINNVGGRGTGAQQMNSSPPGTSTKQQSPWDMMLYGVP